MSKRLFLPLLSKYQIAWASLLLANILWSTSYVAAKFVLAGVSVPIMLALRMGISSLILLPWLIVTFIRKKVILVYRDIPQLVILIMIGFVINNLLEYSGLAITMASDVALLISCESIFTAILSWIVLRETFKLSSSIALCIGLLGVYLVIARGLVPSIVAGGGVLRIIGDLLVILALFVEALYTIRGKEMLKKYPPLFIISISIVGSLLFWIPATVWEVIHGGWHTMSPIAWASITWIAVMSTIAAYFLWFFGLLRINGSSAASTLFLQPFLGTLLAILLLHDQLTPATIIGGILIILSVFALSRLS